MAPRTTLSAIGLATVLLGAFLSIADFFIVNVALPTIDSRLHASSGTLELVVAGYGVPYALLLVLGGRLGDLYGRRRLFMLGMSSFTIFSLLCGLAPSAAALVTFRGLQGASAALMVPQVLATIQASRSGQQRARAIGFYGATAGIAAVVGQVAGGALVAANIAGTSWRPIFLVNVPLGLIGLALAWRTVPATHSPEPVGSIRSARCFWRSRSSRCSCRSRKVARSVGRSGAGCSSRRSRRPPTRSPGSSGASSGSGATRSCRRRSCACRECTAAW